MAIHKEKKEEILKKLKEAFAHSESLAFVNFHGLSVDDTNVIRAVLRNAGVSYMVAKKTLIRKALEETSFTGDIPNLEGELGVAWSEDPTAPSREIYTFVKKHNGTLALLGGVFEGAYKDAVGITEIATIPSLEVLRGMFLNVINSPIQGLAISLSKIAEKKA
jgi:large subunit ribosomal protein L10